MLSIVLARRDFREYDQIISLYTKEKGKIELIARGVKKIKSKNTAHLEPFSVVDVGIASGKEIDYLTKVQGVEFYKNIRNNFQKSLISGYVVGLINKLVQVGESDERIFNSLINWLDFLNNKNNSRLIFIDSYVVLFLYYLGFDISCFEDIQDRELKKYLEILKSGDWEVINNLNLEEKDYKKIHNIIYKFLIFQVEKNIDDWSKLAQLSKIG
jgi:recombinational DNA repair protein (RecF pathway)